jgi:hypothetical protein
MSMRDISIAVRAENRASSVFRTISSDIINLGVSFGALDSQTGRAVMQIFSIIRVLTSVKAIIATTTATQTAQNAVVATGAGVQSTLAVSTTGAMTAQVAQNTATQTGIASQILHSVRLGISAAANAVYSAAAWVSTAAQSALNISYATFLALTGVGIAVIAAAAIAMFAFAKSMDSATSSVKTFNNASISTSSHVRSIQRAGESAVQNNSSGFDNSSMVRKGVEGLPW